jgi:hypothetical protein
MKHWSRFTTINDLMYAAVVFGALVLSALGLADELFNLRSERILAATVYALAVASVTYAAVLAQPSIAAVRASLRRRRRKLAAISL